MPGIDPIAAMAVKAFALPRCTFKRGRNFAPRLRLVPVQHSKGGRQRLGPTSKMDLRDIRSLSIGAMSVSEWAFREAPLVDLRKICVSQ
ncbi:transposase [Devosia enhydra]|uniref:transposase n=1 Tax=Devosia enhydra TaxID=665118 RepID=UPI002452BE92|nr:transposase [Devosia enhydra]